MVGTILLLMGASKWPYAPKLATSRSTHKNETPSYKVILLGQYEVDTNNSGWDQKPMHYGVDPTNQNHMEIYFGPTITWKNPHVPRFFVSSDQRAQSTSTRSRKGPERAGRRSWSHLIPFDMLYWVKLDFWIELSSGQDRQKSWFFAYFSPASIFDFGDPVKGPKASSGLN